ncbi:MAG: sel1 repeat family protein, partial [Clostridia bacterium]|nr:sel1 repeat family protein [Clostridia bacterium]
MWWMKCAEAGDVDAQNQIGNCYKDGDGVEPDAKEAIKWYQKAAAQSNAESLYFLGEAYYYGICFEEDEAKAFELYKKAAELGYGEAMGMLGVCYIKGQGTEEDPGEALKWLQQGAEKMSPIALYNLGQVYECGIDSGEVDAADVLDLYDKAAFMGYAPAMVKAGSFYSRGVGVEMDEAKALEYYVDAAEDGDPDGQLLAGLYYLNGTGTKPDRKKALHYLTMAIEQGQPQALQMKEMLPMVFDTDAEDGEDGDEGNEDEDEDAGDSDDEDDDTSLGDDVLENFEACEQAAMDGNTEAMVRYGLYYLFGEKGVKQDTQKGLEWIEKGADAGDAVGLKILGDIYEEGTFVEKDPDIAREYCVRAADAGDPDMQYEMAIHYLKGEGIEPSRETFTKAMDWLHIAANQRHPKACMFLAGAYEGGHGVEQNDETALVLYLTAANGGIADAYADAGMCYLEGRGTDEDDEEAVRCFEAGAEAGSLLCMTNLGISYHEGSGVKRNLKKAFKCFKQAADEDYPEAIFYLARMYDDGEGTKEDKPEAVRLYRLAAKKGYKLAQYYAGLSYEYGDGIRKNTAKAIEYYTQASDKIPEACHHLGVLYSNPKSAQYDPKEASKWFMDGAQKKDPACQYEVGMTFYNMEGDEEKNNSMAAFWISESARQDYPDAEAVLGVMLIDGTGMDKDPDEAFKWLRKAADDGSIIGAYNVAKCYMDGIGTRKSSKQAIKFMEIAANEGYMDSKAILKSLTKAGKPGQKK